MLRKRGGAILVKICICSVKNARKMSNLAALTTRPKGGIIKRNGIGLCTGLTEQARYKRNGSYSHGKVRDGDTLHSVNVKYNHELNECWGIIGSVNYMQGHESESQSKTSVTVGIGMAIPSGTAPDGGSLLVKAHDLLMRPAASPT